MDKEEQFSSQNDYNEQLDSNYFTNIDPMHLNINHDQTDEENNIYDANAIPSDYNMFSNPENMFASNDTLFSEPTATFSPQAEFPTENDDYISDEELEERKALERQRAAIRRKKIAIRRRRRKKRLIRAWTCLCIFILILLLIIIGIIKLISGIWTHFSDLKEEKSTEAIVATTEAPKPPEIDKKILAKELPKDRETALAKLEKIAVNNPDIEGICENAAIYPDRILKELSINLEMTNFVSSYPAKINIIFDGNFETKVPKKIVPLYLQFDERWGYADYGNHILAINGDAPTCLSMAYTYLKQDGSMNPIKIADFSMEHNFVNQKGNTSTRLMTEGAELLDLTSKEIEINQKEMTNELSSGKVIICCMKSGDFTKSKKYILIHSYKNHLFYVNDPTSVARSEVGWDYNRLSKQIESLWVIGNNPSLEE